jgi:hypothetical protein
MFMIKTVQFCFAVILVLLSMLQHQHQRRVDLQALKQKVLFFFNYQMMDFLSGNLLAI